MFYSFLKITIGSAVRVFFPRIVLRGAENIPAEKPLIIVSNHPSAFMDPLVLGVMIERELHFFARADIFSPGFGKWIMEKAHMSPIYRIVDGIDSLEKNDAVFAHGYRLLRENKVLLLFGEGVTDEEFVRRVKTMKKGSMRIALGAENKYDFKLGVNIICAGINYSDPRRFRSDLVISFSKPIEVRDYRDLFLEHNNKAMIELNKEIYSRLKQQVVHVDNPEHTGFFEQMLILSGKGINHEFHDPAIPLEERWEYSKKLSEVLNKKDTESPGEVSELKAKLNEYFLKYGTDLKPGNSAPMIFFLFGFPLFLFGILNNYLPVKLSSFLSRNISKRPVFWSGTDMAFSIITVPVYYFIIITLFQAIVGFQSGILQLAVTFVYLFLMPISGLFAFDYIVKFKAWKKSGMEKKSEESERRKFLLSEIEKWMRS